MVFLIYGGMIMKTITINQTIYNIVKELPQARQVLVDLGFAPMAHDATLNTVGRVTTLSTAIKHLSLDMDTVNKAFASIQVEVSDHE